MRPSAGNQKRQIDPIEERIERAWMFHNHVMPNMYRLSGNDVAPYYKVQVGYDFFDPFEEFHIDGAAVVDASLPKASGSAILVPSLTDTLINLCSHIYREGVSMVYRDYNVNWQLGKFCDLLGFLQKHKNDLDLAQVVAKVDAEGIRQPVFYGFYHANEVYGHPIFRQWMDATDPGNHDYLNELRDGDRRAYASEAFAERLFSLRPVSESFHAGWNKQFTRNQW